MIFDNFESDVVFSTVCECCLSEKETDFPEDDHTCEECMSLLADLEDGLDTIDEAELASLGELLSA